MSALLFQTVRDLPASAVPAHCRALLYVLAWEHHDKTGLCIPSLAQLMQETSKSERSVRDDLRWLEEHGFLTREERKSNGWQKTNHYELNLQLMINLIAVHRQKTAAHRSDSAVHRNGLALCHPLKQETSTRTSNYRTDASVSAEESETESMNRWQPGDDDEGLQGLGALPQDEAPGPPAKARRSGQGAENGQLPVVRRKERALSIQSLVEEFDERSAAQYGFLPGRINERALAGQLKHMRKFEGMSLEHLQVMIDIFLTRTRNPGSVELWRQFVNPVARAELYRAAKEATKYGRYVSYADRRAGVQAPAAPVAAEPMVVVDLDELLKQEGA